MVDLEITLNGVSIPTNTSVTLTVLEDVGDDGGSNTYTAQDGQTFDYDNSASTTLTNGQTSYTLSGFDGSAGNRVWPIYEPANSDVTLTAELTESTDITRVASAVTVASTSTTSTTAATGTGDVITTADATATATTDSLGSGATTSVANSQPTATTVAQGTGDLTTTASANTTSTTVSTGARVTTSTATAQSSPTTVIPDAISDVFPAKFRLIRNGTEVEGALYDVEIVSTANPFGNYTVAKIDDTEGKKFDEYTRGTRVDIEYSTNSGISWTGRFSGFVVEARELNEQGADALEVEAYSFDQFLRRDTVTNNQSGNTITEALEDIVKTDTPVTWVASNVTVQDDQTLTRSYRGERVENVIQSLRAKSAFEDFGVTSDLEFFFDPQETTSAPRDIDNSQWFNYDIPEEGKRTINQVTVFFDDGNKSVTVDDGGDKLDLQESLGTDDPITFAEEITREEITDIGDARDEGEKLLSDRKTTLTGTVTTYGLLEAETGDVININIIDRGIDGDFAIAEITYNWGSGTTQLTIVEKRGDQDDLLVGLSDTVKRTEMRPADRDATENRITNTTIGGLITIGGDIDGTSYSAFRYTNAGRNKIRDGWADNGNLNITDIAVGNDDTTPTRTDDALGNELERVSVTETLPDSTTASYEGSFSTADIREIGLFTSDGELIARATIPDTSLSSPVTGTVSLSVNNDASVSRGVLTTTGQTTTRNIIADNSPSLPTQYAYGTGSTLPTESDTALESETVKVGLDEVLVQSADSDADWNGIVNIADTDPVSVSSGELQVLQSCFTVEGEDFDRQNNSSANSDSSFSGGSARQVQDNGAYIEWDFTTEYTIPADQFSLFIRYQTFGSTEIEWSIDGTVLGTDATDTGGSLFHEDFMDLGTFTQPGSIEPGEHTLRVECLEPGTGNDFYVFDTVAPADARFSYTLDNDNGGSSGYLDGPELYPDVAEFAFNEVMTRRTLQNATATQVWNDVSNNQYIELSNDGGNTWITTNNSQTATSNFASAETQIQTRVGFSRFGSRTTATPQTGFNGQTIDSHELLADVDAITEAGIGSVDVRAIIAPGTVATGTNLREAGEFDASDNLLTRTTGLDIVLEDNMRIESSETVRWDNA